LPRKYSRLPNIHIDKGSPASADMTYMLAADIYLGDVSSQVYEFLLDSSQVYEFLLEPRPCIFLNPHGVDWEDDPSYAHWKLGQVVYNVRRQLGGAIDRALSTHAEYLPKQREAFEYTFRTEPDSTAAERGAHAIAGFLGLAKAVPQRSGARSVTSASGDGLRKQM